MQSSESSRIECWIEKLLFYSLQTKDHEGDKQDDKGDPTTLLQVRSLDIIKIIMFHPNNVPYLNYCLHFQKPERPQLAQSRVSAGVTVPIGEPHPWSEDHQRFPDSEDDLGRPPAGQPRAGSASAAHGGRSDRDF